MAERKIHCYIFDDTTGQEAGLTLTQVGEAWEASSRYGHIEASVLTRAALHQLVTAVLAAKQAAEVRPATAPEGN